MSDSTFLVLFLLVLGIPAFFLVRSARRTGESVRHAERLRVWAAARGWAYRGPDPDLVGRWQVEPFVEPERWVDDALVGEHRGRRAASFRLEVGTGERARVFHVLTLELVRPRPPQQLATTPPPRVHGGATSPGADVRPDAPAASGDAVGARLREPDAAGMAVRVVRGELVGWVRGEPVLGELTDRLDVLADVADLLDARG